MSDTVVITSMTGNTRTWEFQQHCYLVEQSGLHKMIQSQSKNKNTEVNPDFLTVS